MNSPLSSEEILSLYANGELVAAIGQYHHEDGEQALFTERCVREGLNNSPVLGDNSAPRLGR